MSATNSPMASLARLPIRRGAVFGGLIIIALLAFEVFNYSTTDFALADLLGDLRFMGVRWATILAVAFCGIDFAGIARLFTPERGDEEPKEVWYLFGAWLLAATMNAMLTWWGVSLAALNHERLGNAVIERETLIRVVPIFVAIMVWLIRVLIIGTFSVAGDHLFRDSAEARPRSQINTARNLASRPAPAALQRPAVPLTTPTFRPSPKSAMPAERGYNRSEPAYTRPEPTYHPVSMSQRSGSNNAPRQ